MHEAKQMNMHDREYFIKFYQNLFMSWTQWVYVEKFQFCWIMRDDAFTFAYLTILSTKLGPHNQELDDRIFPYEIL